MNSSRPLVPSFIRNIDRRLLLSKPSVWSARTHLILWFGFLFAAVLAFFCMLLFSDVKQDSNIFIITGFVIMLSLIGFIFWLVFLLRFNVFKRYGNPVRADGLKTFLLFFINILVIVSVPFIPAAVETFMANRQFGDMELVKDVNELNIDANLLEYSRIPKDWKADTFDLVKETYSLEGKDTVWNNDMPQDTGYHPNRSFIAAREFRYKTNGADSLRKINDSLFVILEVPDYTYMHPYNLRENFSESVLSSKEIYYKVIRNYTVPDKNALLKRMTELKTKYYVPYYGYESYDVTGHASDSYDQYISAKYSLGAISGTINVIADKKYRWDNEWQFLYRFMFYFTLVLTMLVFIFRHSTVKTFFLSLLVGVLLAVITGLFATAGNMGETGFYVLMLFYFFVFALASILTRNSKTRNLFSGISINFFLFGLPFIPLVICLLYYEIQMRSALYFTGDDSLKNFQHRYYIYFYAELLGFALLLILLEPVFKKLYRAWYAAPEE